MDKSEVSACVWLDKELVQVLAYSSKSLPEEHIETIDLDFDSGKLTL